MKDFFLGWLLGRALANSDDGGNGLVDLIGNFVILLFVLAALAIWGKLCMWISSFAGPLGPFIGVFVPLMVVGISQDGIRSKSQVWVMVLGYAVITILFLLYLLWMLDYI